MTLKESDYTCEMLIMSNGDTPSLPISEEVMRPSLDNELLTVKRNYIVSSAVDLFFERGYSATTLDVLAKKVGVNKPFIYKYFKNKEAILVEICEQGVVRAIEVADRELGSLGSPTERLQNMIRKFTLVVLEHQRNVTIYFREVKNIPVAAESKIQALRTNLDEKLAVALEEGASSGEFDVEDPVLTAMAIRGMVSWAFTWFDSSENSSAYVCEKMASLALIMVRSGGSAAICHTPEGSADIP